MMDIDSPSMPPRLDPGRVGDKGTNTTMPLLAPNRPVNLLRGELPRSSDPAQSEGARETRPSGTNDATSFRVGVNVNQPGNPTGRDRTTADRAHAGENITVASGGDLRQLQTRFQPSQQRHHLLPSSSNSQTTSSTNDDDPVFTPPASASDGGMSPDKASAGISSQESQLLQLSQIAAAQQRIPDGSADAAGIEALSKKRTADGVVKHTREKSSVSPVRMGGHSRNTSAVSVASTAGSRIGELSAELKTRLSYAMIKVNHGWQAHTIDQVETLASQATSPTSSNSTIHLRNGSSASPQLSTVSHRGSNNTTPATGPQHQFPGRLADPSWRESPNSGSRGSPTSPIKGTPSLAPPVSIQPARQLGNARRNSNQRPTPTFLSASHQASPSTNPHTPGQPSPYIGNAHHRTPMADPILFSPHQNVREQDAIESLLFMSSPGNSANLKHAFPTLSSQPPPSSQGTSQRTALPTSQPRKSLPSGRPAHHMRSQSHTQKRVGFEKSPGHMDIDEPSGATNSRATPRRKLNGSLGGHQEAQAPPPRLKQLPVSSGLTVPSRPRPALGDEDIDRMLDRVAADDGSDSEGEIQIPVARVRRDGAHVIGI
ncbi:hypothetical protein B0T19DRAFT_200412 [Cercophora scortea]|uniref:Uncharacterized protein n=1 Tax=Cercophora scortea TaxID=314031 RepID=A0AAE0IDS4_9PEZI|nr:hypothetical protein B0T19DRAFT_200412 [Cercophora scortea]